MGNVFKEIAVILKSKDLKEFKGDLFGNIFKLLVLKDTEATVDMALDTKRFIYQMPNILFWDKMERLLYGTYKNFGEQVKMAQKFSDDDGYIEFTKRQMQLVDSINDDKKIDFFANLTRAFLLECIDIELYFKLSEILSRCTREELFFLKNNYTNKEIELNIYVDSFLNLGLAVVSYMETNGDSSRNKYKYNYIAKALDMYSLSFGEEKYTGYDKVQKYSDLECIPTTAAMTFFDAGYEG